MTQCYIYAMFDSKRLMTSAVATTSKITRLLALLWNIPDPFLDQNCSLYNFKPSYSLLTLRASWLVWCLYRFYQLNKSRCKCKWDVTVEYLTRAIFEGQLKVFHVVHHLFKRYVFILSTKMRTETKTVPSTRYIFNVSSNIILAYLRKSFILDNRVK